MKTKTRGNGGWGRDCHPAGMTLMELLVVVAVVAALATMGVLGIGAAAGKAKQAACSNNLRQIGAGLQLYSDDHGGRYPETTHTGGLEQAWIYQLESYLGNFDQTRVCPADPKREQRLAAKGTSYVLNSFVFVPKTDPFGRPVGKALNRVQALPDPGSTLLAFCCSDHVGVAPGNDHTHSERWTNWDAVLRDIAPDRHGGKGNDGTRGRSNYLFADGRVETWSAADVKKKIESGVNIAKPPGLD